MRPRWSERQRWWLLAAGWLALLVLGIGGFVQQSNELDLDRSFLDHLYFTLQLAALSFEGESDAMNWRLEIARFVAPLMAAGTLLQSASVVFRDQFIRWRAGRAAHHTVVCGLDPVGARLVESLHAQGRVVVAIEPDPASPGAAAVAELGIPVIAGDPTDPATLTTARVDRAAHLVAATDRDATNVAITSAARAVERPAKSAPLRCAVRLEDGELAHLLRATELSGAESIRIEFFNVHERAAQALVSAHPPAAADDPQPHLVVLGLGQFGCSVLVAAAQHWAEHGTGRLPVTLIDRRAAGRLHAVVMQHPALATAIEPSCVALDIGSPERAAVDEFDRTMAERPPSLVVVAFEDESLAWTSALFVRRRVRDAVDIVVRTDSDGGFGQHLQGRVDTTGTARIVTFPFLDEACSIALVEGGVREQLARSLHEDHIARAGLGGTAALHRAWDELGNDERESSRAAADAIVARVGSLGGELVPLRQWGGTVGSLGNADIERLAVDEHARWMAERRAGGWTYGAVRDDSSKQNPLLVDWSDLPAAAREHNLQAAAALPALLARAGFEIEFGRPAAT